MNTDTPTLLLDGQRTGIRRELGRYTVDGAERILFGQRINPDTIKITDKPAVLTGRHRSYRVDTLDASEGYGPIQALVRDYLHQARCTHTIPAAPVTDLWFDDLADSFRYDGQRAAVLKEDADTDEQLGITAGVIA
jgi:hypothetical protein